MHHVLVLEPFGKGSGGGSHRSLYEGWRDHSRHRFTVLELPAVHWKWRSRHSSLTLAREACQLAADSIPFDAVFCSEILNLPEWKGFAGNVLGTLPSVAYFHENQFTYPLSPGEQRDYNFAYSNLLTWLSADAAWFNSAYHLDDFYGAARDWLRRMPDYRHQDELEAAYARSCVLPPGISPPISIESRSGSSTPDLESSDLLESTTNSGADRALVVGWVSRWEHDKRPDVFCRAVDALLQHDDQVELILLGQQFSRRPPELERLLQDHGNRIRHSGHAEDRQRYWELLSEIDLVVSTAVHEFFGIGILEAVSAGATPLLPCELAYPEVFNLQNRNDRKPWFYHGELTAMELANAVERVRSGSRLQEQASSSEGNEDLRKYRWIHLAEAYDLALEKVIANHPQR
ncbi:MAG: DUF3524 domain-containing protein [Planctomycetota bacterium]